MQRINKNDEIQQNEKKVKLANISVASNSAGFAGAAGMGLSYTGAFANYFNSPVGIALTGVGSLILFPIIALSSAIQAALSLMHTNLDRRRKDNKLKNRNIASSIISILSFVGFTTAIIGSLFAATTFVLAAPMIFMCVIGARALCDIVIALYWMHRSSSVESNTKYDTSAKKIAAKEKYESRAEEHAKSAALGAIAFVATTTVFLLGYLVAAPIGIAINAVFMAMAITGIVLGIKSSLAMQNPVVVEAQEEKHSEEQKPLMSAMDNDLAIDADNDVSTVLTKTGDSLDDRMTNARDWSKNTGIFITQKTQVESEDKLLYDNTKFQGMHQGH